jgi:hypothetical protein
MGSPSRSSLPNQNTTTPKLPPIPKRLHYILIASLVPSWGFGLPLLILDASVWSILAFIFSTFSGLISLYRVRQEETYEYQIRLPGDDDQEVESVSKHAGLFACADFVLAGGLINWIILALVEGSGGWRCRPAVPFLLAYGSMVWLGQWYVFLLLLKVFGFILISGIVSCISTFCSDISSIA